MPYTTAYQASFQSFENEIVNVTIYDTASFTSLDVDMNIILLGYGSQLSYPAGVFKLKTVDDERNVFKSIRAKQATLSFFSSNLFDITLFSQGADDRFLVIATLQTTGKEIFRGYLVMDDHQRPFMPHPNAVTLTATDNIGTLKDIPLTDFTGLNPKGKFRIAQFVAWALSKTNLKLPILFCSTWYEESNHDHPWWDVVYLDAKTFESEIGVSIDCYTVLERLLGFDLVLSQYQGTWFVAHVDEMDQPFYQPFRFTWDGIYSVQDSNFFPQKLVGSQQTIRFIQEDQIISYIRPHKSVRLQYELNYPREIVDNIDYSRGSVLTPVVPNMILYVLTYSSLSAFPSPGITGVSYFATDTGKYYQWIGLTYRESTGNEIPSATAYHFDDWTYTKLPSGTPLNTGYIERIFQGGIERTRYIVIPESTSGGHAFYCNPLPLEYKDKISIQVDRRLTDSVTGGTGLVTENFMQVRLYGDNGTFWAMTNIALGDEVPGDWVATDSTFATNGRFVSAQYRYNEVELTNWQNLSVDSQPVPVSGTVVIYLMQNVYRFSDRDTHFANLQVTYTPYINGTYTTYKSIYREVDQAGNYKSKIESSVFIYDCIRVLFKGSMLKLVSGKYVPVGRFYAGGDLARQGITAPVPAQYLHPFAHLQIYALWNKSKLMYSYVGGTLLGLHLTDATVPDMNSVYLLDDAYPGFTNNKKFIATDIDQDFDTCQWTATLLEISDTTKPNSYEDVDPETINYLT